MSVKQDGNLRALNVLRYNLPQLHTSKPLIPRILSKGRARHSIARTVYMETTPHYEG